ncbi:DUF421 domain-containing protein [Legionella lytica]|uniref:DUF421 domain-containing protein n=1 Tax=Legionella lytica TaxID=96232 RepID=A0ABY4YA18_9GAMM|nr:YetF domain-containing protein [Legionella lytica]USQ14475.1 DUF421 domain-containing protein [Legionella lytica]
MEQFLGWNQLLEYGLYTRGILITLYAIVLFRTNSNAIYGEHSPLDFIIYIILGAILGEAIVNNIPLLPSMVVCLLIVIIHRFLAYLSYKNHKFGKYIKGQKVRIIKQGRYIEKNMRCCRLTANDVLQSLRIQHSMESIKSVKCATLERGGKISFIFN